MIRVVTSMLVSPTLKRAALAILVLLAPSALFAQGCAMCYQTAAGSGAQFIQALRHGILIMFFPPILIMAAIFYAAYRKRNQFNGEEDPVVSDPIPGDDAPSEWSLADEAYLRKLVEGEQ
jgi:hypothetical protein